MANSRKRFILPGFVFILCVYFSMDLIYSTLSQVPSIDLIPVMGLSTENDITVLLVIAVPILLIEYALFAIPGAMAFLFVAKTMKAASYELNIMNIGKEFGGMRMIRRAAAPASFSAASVALTQPIVNLYLFGAYEAPSVNPAIAAQFSIVLTLLSSLLFLPVALLFFMPTWILNDAGIITHLKKNRMQIRQPPDTQGVGRWAGSILGGYALIAYPIAMFNTHFVVPYLNAGVNPLEDISQLIIRLMWIVGLPLILIAFVLPVVALNERTHRRTKQRITGFARKLGATLIRKEKIEKVKTPGRPRGVPGVPGEVTEELSEDGIPYDDEYYDQETGIMSTAKKSKTGKAKGTAKASKSAKTTKKKQSKKK